MEMNWKTEEEFETLRARVEEESPYKRIPSTKAKWMTVAKMGKLLGLKKTDRYWLVHKNYFRTEVLEGQMRIEIESFEKWYANQIKYKKVTGEEPGLELKSKSYSIKEISEMLDLTDGVVYDLIRANDIEVIIVDYWKRVPREAFWDWYKNQNRYRTREDKEKDAGLESATMSMPEMARALGVERSTVYTILRSQKYGKYFSPVYIAERKRYWKSDFEKFLKDQNIYKLKNDDSEFGMKKKKQKTNRNRQYLTVEEAAEIADVSKGTIINWCHSEKFPSRKVGKVIRIPKVSFMEWIDLRNQEKEKWANGITQRT